MNWKSDTATVWGIGDVDGVGLDAVLGGGFGVGEETKFELALGSGVTVGLAVGVALGEGDAIGLGVTLGVAVGVETGVGLGVGDMEGDGKGAL